MNDLQVNAFQDMLKREFKHIGGINNTLLQRKTPLQPEEGKMLLQIIHIRGSHWAAIQVHGRENVCIYDSVYNYSV